MDENTIYTVLLYICPVFYCVPRFIAEVIHFYIFIDKDVDKY